MNKTFKEQLAVLRKNFTCILCEEHITTEAFSFCDKCEKQIEDEMPDFDNTDIWVDANPNEYLVLDDDDLPF